jgi:hypothetical protein
VESREKIDIKSEIYRAAVPHITRVTKAALARYKELPKLDVLKNFVVLYFALGFILEGVANAIPGAIIGFFWNGGSALMGVLFFLFWPLITFFVFGDDLHTILSLALVFVGATYISHLKQLVVETRLGLRPVQSPATAIDALATPAMIDITHAPANVIEVS